MRESPRTDFGRRLKECREDAGLSQPALAKLVDLSQSNISELESSGQGSAAVTKLAIALSVDAHWLATGEGPREPLSCPLSIEVQQTIGRLNPAALAKLEAQLRVQLDLPPLPNGLGNSDRDRAAA